MIARLTAIAMLLATGGCATSYQPKGFAGGYSDLRLNDNTVKISVAGNGYTSKERANDIAMLRAADLTSKAGYERFLVVSGGAQNAYSGSTPVTSTLIGKTVITDGGEPIFKPEADYVIRMLHLADPGFADAFDAKLIYAQLRPKFPPDQAS